MTETSKSRDVKIEMVDKLVSIDLIVRSLIELGSSQSQIGKKLCSRDKVNAVHAPKSRKKAEPAHPQSNYQTSPP